MATEPIVAGLDLVLDAHIVHRARKTHSAVLADFWALTKPEINFLIAIAAGTGFCLGRPTAVEHFPWTLFVHTVLGTTLVASGASTLNQLIERKFDAQMRRTARRPIPAGRVEPIIALIFGVLLSVAGALDLALAVRPAASLLALLTLFTYLFLYTPLKRRTPWCTMAGAFPGAAPVLIGYVAVAGKLNSEAWLLYAVLFLWQFPHFMAIAWMYREDYARAGYQILPSGKYQVRFMAWQTALPALALLSVTFVPMALNHANPVLVAAIFLLSLYFLYCAARLALLRTSEPARRLLLISVLYLPMVFLLQVLARA
jgi:protoheme IX farnesyltransferase